MSKSNTGVKVINPFSEEFEETWALWLAYKFEYFKFRFKGVMSEQAALSELVDLCKGDEEVAKKIIRRSISNQWQGLFPLRNSGNNGTAKQSNPKNGKPSPKSGISREAVNTEANKRYGNGQQTGSSSNPT